MKVYHVHGDNLAFHICPTDDLAMAVFQDLEKRFPGSRVEMGETSIGSGSIHIDFGGSICSNWKAEEVAVTPDGTRPVTVSFWPHHVDLLIGKLKRLLEERERVAPDGTRYIKIHAAYNAVCIGSEHARVLLDSIRSRLTQIKQRESEILSDFDRAIEAMRGHSNVLVPPPMDSKLAN